MADSRAVHMMESEHGRGTVVYNRINPIMGGWISARDFLCHQLMGFSEEPRCWFSHARSVEEHEVHVPVPSGVVRGHLASGGFFFFLLFSSSLFFVDVSL